MDSKVFKELAAGDKVKVSRIVTVASTGGIFSLYDKNGNHYYDKDLVPGSVAARDGVAEDSFDMELVEKAKTPKLWPPQRGDVWRTAKGDEIHVTGARSSSVSYRDDWVTDQGIWVGENVLRGSALVYRKGDGVIA